jgi:hypothetical protein
MRRKPHDPLAFLLARKRIDTAQYRAAVEYRRLSAIAERSPEALEALARCQRELGDSGVALLDSVLLCAMSTKAIAARHGKLGPSWESYFARRLGEALTTLAIVFGFAGEPPRQRIIPPSSPAPSGTQQAR